MGVEQHTGRMRARALARDGQAKARRPYYFEVDNSLSGKFKSFGWMTGFALHGSPIQVELVPGRLFQVLAHPALGRPRLTEIRQGLLPNFLLALT